jgi:hypothetical protein
MGKAKKSLAPYPDELCKHEQDSTRPMKLFLRPIFLAALVAVTAQLLLCSFATDTVRNSARSGTESSVNDSLVVAAFDTLSLKNEAAYLKDTICQNQFDRDKWNAAKKGLDYSETHPTEKNEKTITQTWSSRPSLFSGNVVKYIFVGIIILLLTFLLFITFSNKTSNKKIRRDKILVTIEDIEDIHHVPESELQRLLREALERQDYNEAIRIYYVFIIRELSEKKLISWKKEKTNREYLSELNTTIHHTVFREITLLFERVWYGDTHLEEHDYSTISPLFKTFAESIKLSPPREK